jgi:translation initiation factor 2-alpha kinase 4
MIYITMQAPDKVVLKLGGTAYARKIIELHRSNPFLKSHEDEIPDSWSVSTYYLRHMPPKLISYRLGPDELNNPYAYSAKRDMWQAGLLMVQMLFGYGALTRFSSLHALLSNGKRHFRDSNAS